MRSRPVGRGSWLPSTHARVIQVLSAANVAWCPSISKLTASDPVNRKSGSASCAAFATSDIQCKLPHDESKKDLIRYLAMRSVREVRRLSVAAREEPVPDPPPSLPHNWVAYTFENVPCTVLTDRA